MLRGKTIVLGVTGSIAAYKAADLVSKLKKIGADVWVILTDHGSKFITPLTLKTLSGNTVLIDTFDEESFTKPVLHISISEKADLILIAPATADIIGKIAGGIADDLLSTIVMSSNAPKIIAPAMNTKMWDNGIVQENVAKLKKLNFKFVGPEVGRLACGDVGLGRFSDVDSIIKSVTDKIGVAQDLSKKKVLVTAGGTRESIDPVRFISNCSSGKMGYAIAQAAADRGADVTLISAPTNLMTPENVKTIKINSAQEMYDSVMENYQDADIVVMAAAVADYRPVHKSKVKIKKSQIPNLPAGKAGPKSQIIELEDTKDILAELGKKKGKRKLIGFALETDNMIENAKKKLKNKNLDLIVANGPDAFDGDNSSVCLININGEINKYSNLSKQDIAEELLDFISILK